MLAPSQTPLQHALAAVFTACHDDVWPVLSPEPLPRSRFWPLPQLRCMRTTRHFQPCAGGADARAASAPVRGDPIPTTGAWSRHGVGDNDPAHPVTKLQQRPLGRGLGLSEQPLLGQTLLRTHHAPPGQKFCTNLGSWMHVLGYEWPFSARIDCARTSLLSFFTPPWLA